MSLEAPASARQAALVLHAMQEADRNWILAALMPAQSLSLKSMLVELHELGVPADARLLRQVLPKHNGEEPSRFSSLGSRLTGLIESSMHAITTSQALEADLREDKTVFSLQAMAELSPTQIDSLASVLRNEPAGLVARLLQMRPWMWQEVLLSRLGAVQRRKVLDELKNRSEPIRAPAPPTAVERELLMLIRSRLADQDTSRQGTALDKKSGVSIYRNQWRSRIREWFGIKARTPA